MFSVHHNIDIVYSSLLLNIQISNINPTLTVKLKPHTIKIFASQDHCLENQLLKHSQIGTTFALRNYRTLVARATVNSKIL